MAKKYMLAIDSVPLIPSTTEPVDRNGIDMVQGYSTILGVMRERVTQMPNKVCFIFLNDSGREVRQLTYSQLDEEAKRVAAMIQQQSKTPFAPGDRVILCYSPGVEFLIAFWGCLYAGAIACAVYPPHPLHLARDLPRFIRMIYETGASLVLTSREYRFQSVLGTFKAHMSAKSKVRKEVRWPQHLHWLTTNAPACKKPSFDPTFYLNAAQKDIAFIQYSSGATADPKPVMISHRNLYAQISLFRFGTGKTVMMGWLPPYHDNGLVGFNLAPIFCDGLSVQMSPLGFLKDPTLWLKMCSKYKATFTCAPPFAYLLAAKKTPDSVAASLDLSDLQDAATGADPIRGEYLKQFVDKFGIAGFRPERFNCGYGGAEFTLFFCGYVGERSAPRSLLVDKHILETTGVVKLIPHGDVRRETGKGTQLFIACGSPMSNFEIQIVNLDTQQPLSELKVGEIWVRGDSIAEGYWQLPELTQERFKAVLRDGNHKKKYFRSGDLGFMHQGELFYYSRLQDTIEMDGRRICPQAIENSAERANNSIRPGCISAFTHKAPDEALVIIAELKTDMTHQGGSQVKMLQICRDIVRKVAEEQNLECSKVVLIQPRTIPKTTSGKLQRNRAREALENQQLRTQYVYENHFERLSE